MTDRKFRRPAMLTAQRAADIVGDADPAEHSELAHSTAWALMGVATAEATGPHFADSPRREPFDQETMERLREAVRADGVDLVAGTWSRSPAFTLPGALWRLYLLYQWHQLNEPVVEGHYETGVEVLEADAEFSAADSMEAQLAADMPSLQQVLAAVAATLNGYVDEDGLSVVLEAASRLLRVIAAGVGASATWITDKNDALAYPVTLRERALLVTADELVEAAHQARQGTLE